MNLSLTWQFLQRNQLGSWQGTCRSFGVKCHLHNIETSYPWTSSSLISFNNILSFSVYKSFISLVTFINKYFIFDAIVNEIVFLLPFLGCLFLAYKMTFLCVDLVSYNFAEFIIGFNIILWIFKDFLHIRWCYLQIAIVSLLPFQSGYLLFLFFVPIFLYEYSLCVKLPFSNILFNCLVTYFSIFFE